MSAWGGEFEGDGARIGNGGTLVGEDSTLLAFSFSEFESLSLTFSFSFEAVVTAARPGAVDNKFVSVDTLDPFKVCRRLVSFLPSFEPPKRNFAV